MKSLEQHDWNVLARGTNDAALLSHYEAAKALGAGEIKFPPRMISFWPSDRCNLRCRHCLYEQHGALMDVDKFKAFAKEAKEFGVEAMEASGGGEPTWNGRFYEMMHYAKSLGLSVGLLTNGFWLDTQYLISDFDYVRISVDAACKEVYNKLKNPQQEDAFDVLCASIRRLIAEKKALKSPLKVIIKCLLSKMNKSEIVSFGYLGLKLDVDAIHYKLMHSKGGTLNDKERERASLEIEHVRKNVFENTLGSATLEVPFEGRCFMAPIHAVLRTNGDLMVCCYFEDLKIGNVFEDDLWQLWGSEAHHKIMSSIDKERCAKVDCRWHRYNRIMADLPALRAKFI